jgi:sugar-phosphatase
MKFEALVFDMDGVLIDSEPYWRHAQIEVFKTVGLHLTDEDCMKTTGFRFDEVVEYWFHIRPWSNKSVEEVEREVLDKMEYFILHQAPLMPGVKEVVAQLGNVHYKTAVASSSALRLIKAMEKRLGGLHHFDALVSAEFEPYGKPHPAVFLSAAKVLGVKPEKCLVIEDSLNGVIAAKAARMSCVAVPYPHDFDNPKFAIADFTFRTISDLISLL